MSNLHPEQLKDYTHVSADTVNQAIEDIQNGNRPLMSRGILQRRILEVAYDRAEKDRIFQDWVQNKFYRVKQ